MELHLVDLRISLLIAAHQIGEMQESSRACERALLVVAAQSALRAARLSVAAVQEATGEAQVALAARRRLLMQATRGQRRRPLPTYTT